MHKLLIIMLTVLVTGLESQAQGTFTYQELKNWWGGRRTNVLNNSTVGNVVVPIAGTILSAGQEMVTDEKKYSANGNYFIIVQTDGHICIYVASNNGFVWGSGTNGQTPGGKLVMQTDGNLVFYGTQNQALWSSGTYGGQYNEAKYKPTRLVLGNDGKLTLYSDSGYKVWTNTEGKLPLR